MIAHQYGLQLNLYNMYSYVNDATDLNETILLLEIHAVFETQGEECWEGGPFFTVGQSH